LKPELMLQKLAALLAERGYLTGAIIQATPGVPGPGSYRTYFGSLGRAYELVGYAPTRAQRQRFRDSA
jgi:hypothetical protein